MILVVGFILVVASVPLLGGTLAKAADLRLRWVPAAAIALGGQILIINVLPEVLPGAVAAAGHLLTYALAICFLVANRGIKGLWVLGLGGLLNLAAIGANGGVMPASPAALRRAGMDATVEGFTNSTAVAQPRLAQLGDIFAVPEGWPLANVFSIGDVLLLVGAAMVLHFACGSQLRPRERDPQVT